MACSNCKDKEKSTDYEPTNYFSWGVKVFVIAWSVLAVYGLFTLIQKFL